MDLTIRFVGENNPDDVATIREAFTSIIGAIRSGAITPINIPQSVTFTTDFDTFRQLYPWSAGANPETYPDAYTNGYPNDLYFGFRPGTDNKNVFIYLNADNGSYERRPDLYLEVARFV